MRYAVVVEPEPHSQNLHPRIFRNSKWEYQDSLPSPTHQIPHICLNPLRIPRPVLAMNELFAHDWRLEHGNPNVFRNTRPFFLTSSSKEDISKASSHFIFNLLLIMSRIDLFDSFLWMPLLVVAAATLCCQLTSAQYGSLKIRPHWLMFEIICNAKPLDGFYGDEEAVAAQKWSKANFNDSLFEICSAHSKSRANYQGVVSFSIPKEELRVSARRKCN